MSTPGAPAPDDVRLARAYLSRVAEPPAAPLVAFVRAVGAVEAARRVRAGEQLPADVDAVTRARRRTDRAESDLAAAAARGGRLLVPEDPDWPAAALRAFDGVTGTRDGDGGGGSDGIDLTPPLALWVRGVEDPTDAGRRSAAVVGARAATDYGRHVAGHWSALLAEAGVTVVSGAALGIDGAAHRGALAAEGTTVAVVACGIDRPYPPAHTRLLDHVAAHGLVVSEYPPGTVPARHRFLVRNRLIAAWSTGTVVVEAGARSGARRTALCARRLGRAVMAVPGPVTSASSLGCHALVREQEATIAGRVTDVLEAVGSIGELAPDDPRPVRPTDGLPPEAALLHEAVPLHAARDEARLAHDAGVDPRRAAQALVVLEDEGLVQRGTRGWIRRPE